MLSNLFSKTKIQKKIIRHLTLVFVDRDKCTFVSYPDDLVKMYLYPPADVLDGDVLNREELREGLTKWIQESNLKPTEVVYVVSPSLSFERTITLAEKSDELHIINSFIDSVPFQKIITARITIGDNTHIIVTNKELINSITYSLELLGFTNLAIFPYQAIGSRAIAKSTNPLNDLIELGKHFLVLIDEKKHEMLEFGAGTSRDTSRAATKLSVVEVAQQPVNPLIAVGMVLFLIVVGGGVMYWRYNQAHRSQKVTVDRLSQGRLIHSSPAGVTSLPTAEPTTEKNKIEIIYTAQTEALYQKINADIATDQRFEITSSLSTGTTQKNKFILKEKVATQVQARLSDALKLAGVKIEAKIGEEITQYDVVIQIVEPQ